MSTRQINHFNGHLILCKLVAEFKKKSLLLFYSYIFLFYFYFSSYSESDEETWYYSTKAQLDELIETLDSSWESDLISYITELKDDIQKQMLLTEELTNAVRGNKKTVLDMENGM